MLNNDYTVWTVCSVSMLYKYVDKHSLFSSVFKDIANTPIWA